MESNAIVQIRNVSKKIGKKQIIDDISFEVHSGEVFGFLGPNGAGKTTTIRMLLGLMKMNQGEILINGYNIERDFEKAIAHVGGIVENPEMYKFLSGYRNLKVYSRMYSGIDESRIQAVVKQVGLEKSIKNRVRTYSLGMRQRLGVAQALLHKPTLLVLDEPTNGLDPAGIRELRAYMRRLAQEENLAVLVSSHLLSEMELMCDRIAIIQNGKIVNVMNINQNNATEEISKIKLVVSPIEFALKVLESLSLQPDEVFDDCVDLTVQYTQIPAMITSLAKNNIQIFEARILSKSLEDKFMEITGGEING